MPSGARRLRLRVVPGAPRSEVAGRLADGRVKVKVAAPAREGRANRALLAFLAGALGVRRGSVRLVAGETARDKVVEVEAPPEAIRRLLATGGKQLP